MDNKVLHNWGWTILRVVIGVVFAVHGYQKLFMIGLDGVGGFFGSLGIPQPGIAAIIVTFVELIGGIALIAGIGTRVVSALLGVTMLVALVTVHLSSGFFVSNGGYEFVLTLLAACIFFALAGAGPYGLDVRIRRR